MSLNECSVCFIEDQKENMVTCFDKSCNSFICLDCTISYFKICNKDKKIPRCPSVSCNSYILYRNIKNFGKIIGIYNHCCFKELVMEHGNKSRKEIEIENSLQKLRQERKVFIQDKFPKAISFTASLIMSQKINRLEKNLVNKILQEFEKSSRICMNITCDGSLTKDLICLTCSTVFCKDCEKIKEEGHICNKEDVESINEIKNTTRCPTCKLPVFKDEGCDQITCSNCNTNFIYGTGKEGGLGNHGANSKNINVKDKILLSSHYNQYLSDNNLLDLVLKIESMKPKSQNNNINTVIKTYYKNKEELNSDIKELCKLKNKLAKSFDRYINNKENIRLYHKKMNQLEGLMQQQKLNKEILEKVITEI